MKIRHRSMFRCMLMKNVSVSLPDDLAVFIERAVSDGAFDSVDHLFAHAVGLVRTEAALGGERQVEVILTPAPAPTSKPGSEVIQVDMTRKGFDTPAFMANLVGKLDKKRGEEPKVPKN
jgi:Arc/MetJ-type ribon-helix-helix transcriptional regulator